MLWINMSNEESYIWIRKNQPDQIRELLPHYDNNEKDTLNAIADNITNDPKYENYDFEV